MADLIEAREWLTVGRNSFHNGNATIVATAEAPVSIGSFCAFGRNLTIMPLNHDTNYAAVQGWIYRNYFGTPHPGTIGIPSRERSKGGVHIGSDVWIADNVTILSGVTVENGCCIGAGSIVTKSLSGYTIAAGSPCRRIRRRFSDEMCDLLLDLAWWDWTDDRIRRNKRFFCANLSVEEPSSVRAMCTL